MKNLGKCLCAAIALGGPAAACGAELKLWYEQPAESWTAGLPIGNGRLLAVVQGGVEREQIQLNEDTVWTGQPVPRDKPGAARYLGQVRQLMFAGRYAEAERLVVDKMQGLTLAFGMSTYQTLGDLALNFRHGKDASATNYRRELDLTTAIVKVSYKIGDATYTREHGCPVMSS